MEHVEPPMLGEIQDAVARVAPAVVRTPLVPMRADDEPLDILLKHEILQSIGSFKIRGVFNAVARLSEAQRRVGISTVSAGNTAQAVAWAGRFFGVSARSLMPDTAPQAKIDAVRGYGGEPVLVPRDDVFRYMREHGWEDEPQAFIHPWTNRDVMIGHGTMGLEIIADSPEVETVYIPVGGGGLLGGVGSALRALKPSIRIIAVEPAGCPSLYESMRTGRPANVDCKTICDGVAVLFITEEMFPILSGLADEVVLVTEDDVRAMIRRLAIHDHVVAEPAGALAAAAALATPRDERGKSVCLVTGGNIDDKLLSEVLTTHIGSG